MHQRSRHRALFFLLLCPLLSLYAADEPVPPGVYHAVGEGNNKTPLIWHLSSRGPGAETRLLAVVQGWGATGVWAVEYQAIPQPRGFAFRRVMARGPVPAGHTAPRSLTRSAAGIDLRGAGWHMALRRCVPFDRHVEGMYPSVLSNEYIFVAGSGAARRYLTLGADGKGGLTAEVRTRQGAATALLDDWRVCIDRQVQQDLGAPGAVDQLSTWVRVTPKGGKPFDFEIDYERSPVTWLGGRTWEGGKPVRWTHFELIEPRTAPDGWRAHGYRIDRTEEYRIFAPGDNRGTWFVIDERAGSLVSHDGKIVLKVTYEDNYKIMVVTWPEKTVRRFHTVW